MNTINDRQDELSALRQAAERHRAQVLANLLAAVPKALIWAGRAVVRTIRRSIEREQLLALDDRTLRDIGVSRMDFQRAYDAKAFNTRAANENSPARVA